MKSILGSTTRWGLAKDSAGQRSSAKTPPQTPPQTPPPYVTGGGRRGRAKGEGYRPPVLLGSALFLPRTTLSSTFTLSQCLFQGLLYKAALSQTLRFDFYAISNFLKGHTCNTFSLTLKNLERPFPFITREQSLGCVYSF